jgi:hypothetical protein
MRSPKVEEKLGMVMHVLWLENYRNEEGGKPRFKPVKDPGIPDGAVRMVTDEKTMKVSEIIYRDRTLNVSGMNLYECRLGSGGVLEQNIAQIAERLNSNLHKRMNGDLATKYVEACGAILDAPVKMGKEREIASKIHDVWVAANKDWAPSHQLVPFDQLVKEEQDKDMRIACEMLKIDQQQRSKKNHIGDVLMVRPRGS